MIAVELKDLLDDDEPEKLVREAQREKTKYGDKLGDSLR